MPRKNLKAKIPKKYVPPICTKRIFNSKAAAQKAVDEKAAEDIDVSYYICPNCGKFHLTSITN